MEWIFHPLDSSVRKDAFDCGVPKLNDYLKQYAGQNDRKGIAKTFVAILKEDGNEVVGYYTISMSSITFDSLPEQLRKRLPRYPVPAMLIGQLAVDTSMQGRGLGKRLLMDALSKGVRLADEVGIFAVRVDALDDESKQFYLKYGFVPLIDYEFSLFLPMATILKSRK
ncbi:GNAT family N-acetyltransferase [Trichocoleus sp. ST-U3]|uniref:GNAT family N-acetyltransferase n=1 Tax=Coleofasciculus sp. FACHB-542 TaxID=2692787 RepID=UPI001688EDA2|nr:GNAT family N-acetyltransferase [Coleofasciculus sp. FACHB-542]